MGDNKMLDEIFERVDEKATKRKDRRGMKPLSEYSEEERAKKLDQLKRMRDKASLVNKAKKQIKLEALKNSNPVLYEARRRATLKEDAPVFAEPIVVAEPEPEPVQPVVESPPKISHNIEPENKSAPVQTVEPAPVKQKRGPVVYNLFTGFYL